MQNSQLSFELTSAADTPKRQPAQFTPPTDKEWKAWLKSAEQAEAARQVLVAAFCVGCNKEETGTA